MTSRDFCFWLQGFMEVQKPEKIEKEQVEMIQKHLNLVFFHEIDPTYTSDPGKQEAMNAIHQQSLHVQEPFHWQDKQDPDKPVMRC